MTGRWRQAVCGMAATMATVASAGCLIKDTTETWYLDPAGGAVTWAVMEADVRSDAQSSTDRQSEETTYITAAEGKTHPMAKGLAALGAAQQETRIIRSTVPFTVATEGRFTSIAVLGQRLIQRLRLSGSSLLSADGDAMEWTFAIRDPHAERGAEQPTDDLDDLFNGMHDLRVMLTAGHFVSAAGFKLSDDHRVATLIPDDEWDKTLEDGDMVTLKLKWTTSK